MKKHFLFILFICFYLIFSLLTYKHFGITYDEFDMYEFGDAFKKQLLSVPDQDYAGVVPLSDVKVNVFYPAALSFLNPSGSYEIYNLLNLFFALPIFLAAYLLLFKLYKKQQYAILGPVFLFLTPRFSGDIPTNVKDISFAVVFFCSLAAIYFCSIKKSLVLKIGLLGVLFGLSQNFRILGFSLYLILFIFDLYIFFISEKKERLKTFGQFVLKNIYSYLFIFAIAFLVTMFIWPNFGTNPLNHLIDTIGLSTKYPHEDPILTFGQNLISTRLPWYYLPGWIGVTTPVFILTLFLISGFMIRKLWTIKLFLLFFIAFSLHTFVYFLLKPTIYEGLRHYLFLVVIISFLATITFIELITKINNKLISGLLILFAVINGLLVVKDMIRLHPYEYIYFNELIGGLPGAYGRFETDYYGAGFKEAVEWLKANRIKKDKIYKIYACGDMFSSTHYFTPNMIWSVDLNSIDYGICWTRWNQDQTYFSGFKKIHEIQRFGVPLTIIFEKP